MPSNYGAGEDSWESLGQQGYQTSHPKGNEPWIFIGRTDADAPILWPPEVKNSLEKTLMLGKIEGGRRRGWQMMRWLNGITDMMDMSWSRLPALVMDKEARSTVVHWVAKSRILLSEWTHWLIDWSRHLITFLFICRCLLAMIFFFYSCLGISIL